MNFFGDMGRVVKKIKKMLNFILNYSILNYSGIEVHMESNKNVAKLLKRWGKEYKKGFTGYFILMFLMEGEMYGFQITKRLSEISDSKINFGESGIYQILKTLERNGMVSTHWKKSSRGPQRKYYVLEEPGRILLDVFTKDYILPIIDTATRLVERHYPDMAG